jgi:hypothetical protein
MIIILDTNIIFDDWLLNGTQMEILAKLIKKDVHQLWVPQLVIDESSRHFERKCEESRKSIEKMNKILHVLELKPPNFPEPEKARSDYKKKLLKRLKDLDAKILPLPHVKLQMILDRDLDERKPFESSGKGFRDTLIWETILNVCEEHNEDVVLISNDRGYNDLSNEKNNNQRLHEHLLADLEARGIEEKRIKIRRSLREFNNDFSIPMMDNVYREGDDLRGTLAETLDPVRMLNGYKKDAIEQIGEKLPELLSIDPGSIERLSFIDWPGGTRLFSVTDLGNNRISAVIRTSIVFDIKLNVNWEEDIHIIGFRAHKTIIILESQWNQTLKLFSHVLRINLIAEFVFEWDIIDKKAINLDLSQMAFSQNDLT